MCIRDRHTDAVQAVGHLPVDFLASGVDLLTLTGHKVGGPIGSGALLVRREQDVVPLVYGGGQERQIRSGTLDTVGILGLSLAVEASVGMLPVEGPRLCRLRDDLIEGAMGLGYDIRPGGMWQPGDWASRSAGNAHLLVPGCEDVYKRQGRSSRATRRCGSAWVLLVSALLLLLLLLLDLGVFGVLDGDAAGLRMDDR